MAVRPLSADLGDLLASPPLRLLLQERSVLGGAEHLLSLAQVYGYDDLVPLLAELGKECTRRSWVRESGVLLRLLGDVLRVTGDWDRSLATYAVILHPASSDIPLAERASANLGTADILASRGEYEEAVRHVSGAYTIATDLGDPVLEAYVQALQAGIHSRTGDQARARDLLLRATLHLQGCQDERASYVEAEILRIQGLSAFREASYGVAEERFKAAAARLAREAYPVEHGEISRYLGVVLGTRGLHEASLEAHLQALSLFRLVGHRHGQARTFNSIGRTFLQLTRFEEAIFYMEKGVRICRDIRADAELATVCGKIGNAYMLCEDYGRAVHYLQQDLELSKRFHNYYALAYTHRNLGRCYARGGNLEEGVGYLKDALSLFQFVHDGANTGRVYLDLCQADAERGKLQEARTLGGKALMLLINHQQLGEVAFAHVVLGSVERRLGNLDGATDHLREALAGLESLGVSSRLAEAYYEKGLLEVERKATDEAFTYLGAALSIARQLGFKKQAARCFSAMESIGDVELLRHLARTLAERRLEGVDPRRRSPASTTTGEPAS